MANYLAPYVTWIDDIDPAFDEFTYGEHGHRGRRLLRKMKKGNFIFWHRTSHHRKEITAYYVVDRVMRTIDVQENPQLRSKYHNPHLDADDPDASDVIVFGDPIESRVLRRPLPFNRRIAKKLNLGIGFKKGRSETQSIGSACREWRELGDKEVEFLLDEIREWEAESISGDTFFSTDEITQILERDLENYLVREPQTLGKGLRVVKRQMRTPGGRLDILLEDRRGNLVVAELKLDFIGRDAVRQLKNYMRFVKHEERRKVKGIIVCKGVLPAFEEDLSYLNNVSVFTYGWKMAIQEW